MTQVEARLTVNARIYRFQLGSLACTVLSDGSVNYPPGHLFANVPRAQIEGALRERSLPLEYVTTPCTHLYVDSGEHRVLVDTGAGRVAPGTGRLRLNVVAAGIDPAGIDTVVITHAHPTHVGGTLDDGGMPVYANARYYLWKDEWEFWTAGAAFAKAPERHVVIARENLGAVRDRTSLIDHAGEIVPGIDAVPAPGHTPGHMALSVSSDGERLLCIGDTAFHPLHLEHPAWTSIYDIAPQRAAASKRRILNLAAEKRALVCAHHFPPFPGLGYVVKAGEGWRWQPIETKE